ncbi:MAG: chromosome segregation protein SMC [Deltaproteobacteria bacterium]|nr:chromosome segregation protein SMC [Deltaproteobacteria bacterium]
MKIRRLEIQGFKSFAERTLLKFGEGITGVVGPNGCGKSNIVDAIRWVMGEQSAKHLRGSGMQDVIFAGSESRGPMGMCEVTITFKNDGNLVPPEYQRSEEISVTRRLFRDGTSEYAINRVECRLRDILDLFMGTGIGKNAYSIIEQGRIGLIVTAKPEDRRAIIEDAAGVSRYKARRKMAERRIEATEQNLLRVKDITDELQKRLDSLERQAKKAEKYKRIKTELRGLDLHAASHRYLELEALERFEGQKAQALKDQIEAGDGAIAADEQRFKETEGALAVRDGELRLRENQIHEKAQALALAQSQIAFETKERIRRGERRVEAETERADLLAEEGRLEAERMELEGLGETLGAWGGEETKSLDERAASLTGMAERIHAAEQALESEKRSTINALTAIAHHKNNLASLERAGGELELQINRALAAKKAASERAHEAETAAKTLDTGLKDKRQLKLKLEDQRANQEGLLERLRSEFADNEHQLQKSRQELMDKSARLRTLLDIQKNYEGCNDAVRQIMQAKERDPQLGNSLHGLVADVVSAEPRFEAAVEAVLGDRLQYVIVNSQTDGLKSIDFLKQHGDGRSSFIPLDLREDHVSWAPRTSSRPPSKVSSRPPSHGGESPPGVVSSLPTPAAPEVIAEAPEVLEAPAAALDQEPSPTVIPYPVPEGDHQYYWVQDETELWPDLAAPGVCGKMVDLVKAQPGYEHVARVLLGDVVVVERMDQAQQLWTNNGHRKTLVTLSGEVLDPVGVLSGGASGRSSGMLRQKREIKELTDQVRMLTAKAGIAEERHHALRGRISDLEKAIQSLSKEGHQEELSIVNQEKDLHRLEDEARRENDEKRARTEEIELLRKKRASVDEEAEHSKIAVEGLEAEVKASEGRVTERAADVQALKDEHALLSNAVTELKVTVAANREKLDSSRRNLERLQRRLEEVGTRLQKLAEVIAECDAEIERLTQAIAGKEEEVLALEAWVAGERQEVEGLRRALEDELNVLAAEEEQISGRRQEIDGWKEALGATTLTIREHQIGRKNLEEQIDERYRLNLVEILPDFHLLPRQSEEHRAETEKLRRQLDNIGPINLTAIEEFEQVNERCSFLLAQKKDLEDALESLRAAIKRINKTSKERYVEAFRLVNEKFQMVFPKLFNGGRCSLVMTDENDPLESGIEILAQPPGKKLQAVSLLSGGEKALTAVSLIFGIFLIKPTPFCLLDEVDAPLDEANVGRYNEMLREMSAVSQFILITHNKKTMELPDRLYGVTMEEPGISKIVPVDVVESDKRLKAV